jgi:hypothetical protein
MVKDGLRRDLEQRARSVVNVRLVRSRGLSTERGKMSTRMIQFVTKRFTYANVAITAALIFAMAGGAFAATGGGRAANAKSKGGKAAYVITSTKQIKPGVLTALKGSAGPAGPAGAKGVNGVGERGEKGERGVAGASGINGTNGENVLVTPIAKGLSACKGEGGTKLSNKTGEVTTCNGEKGIIHAGETLPAGASEVGAFSEEKTYKEFEAVTEVKENLTTKAIEVEKESIKVSKSLISTEIAFLVPLAGPLNNEHVRYVNMGKEEYAFKTGLATVNATPEECHGSVEKPEAEPGYLCVYIGAEEDLETFLVPVPLNSKAREVHPTVVASGAGASPTGAVIITNSIAEGLDFARGSWAVTAE